jgi:BirA family transcriptional regulator, biotin operon repressor / biotin---[acetyl-CoA-carboxylase] ligase
MFDVLLYGSVGSTNDEARRLARAGAAHGTVVAAREQTAGRGRIGRSWASPPGNLYLSVLLRLDMQPVRIAELAFVAALAVADMVDAFGCRAELKWPNDVRVGGAKISGVLIEQSEGATVLGIGVNVLHCPEGTAYPITSLALHAPSPRPPPAGGGGEEGTGALVTQPLPLREGLGEGSSGGPSVASARAALLAALATRLDTWLAHGFAPIRADWLARAHPIGTRLRADGADGTFAGLDEDGALLLDTPAGRRRIIAGDVTAQVR